MILRQKTVAQARQIDLERIYDAVIVGAGISGLTAAGHLVRNGFQPLILEAEKEPGGRVRTIIQDGYHLDLGFQVFLTAYPEAMRQLDYARLDLCPFQSGALVHYNQAFTRIADPFREPTALFSTLISDIAPMADKLKIAYLRQKLMNMPVDEIFRQPERTIKKALSDYGFSNRIIDRFFRPFFGGITLDASLAGSGRMFDFVFKMMSEGYVAIPRLGMGMISRQLADKLPAESIAYNTRVQSIEADKTSFESQNCLTVLLEGGARLKSRSVVIATEGTEAHRLLPSIEKPKTRTVTCLYFSAPSAPTPEPMLILNGNLSESEGKETFINNLAVMTNVSRALAPKDKHLLSVTVLRDYAGADLPELVKKELKEWFGPECDKYEHLRTFRIERALPDQAPPWLDNPRRSVSVDDGSKTVYVCGDHRDNASINGAMVSGRRTAEQILKDLKVPISKA